MSLLLCKVLSVAAAGLLASACPKQSCTSATEQANAATFARCKTLMRFFLHGSDSNVVTQRLVVTQTLRDSKLCETSGEQRILQRVVRKPLPAGSCNNPCRSSRMTKSRF